jgi:hypothetical protein
MDEVMNNFMTLTEDQKIGFLSAEEQGDYWNSSFAHLMEECRLRQTGVPVDRVKEWHYPNYDWFSVRSALDAFNEMNLAPGQYLVKYSEHKFLKDALEKGLIRVSPASQL